MSAQPPHQPQANTAMSSGFRGTLGVILALVTVFFILPCGACVACNGGLAAIGVAGNAIENEYKVPEGSTEPTTPEVIPGAPESDPVP